MVCEDLLARELRLVSGVRIWTKAPLSPFTTIGTGGNADLLVTVADSRALATALEILGSRRSSWVCVGAGSNLLVGDRGFSGTVIKLGEGFQYVEGLPPGRETVCNPKADGDPVILTAGGGAYLARLSAVSAEVGLAGFEFACGIPGSVGGGVAMNAGAHGRSMADLVEEIEVVSAANKRWVRGSDLEWVYRHCGLPEGSVVTAARLRLMRGDPTVILDYHRSLLRKRRITQPRAARTFGSVFKNPPEMAAGQLLENAGLKGVRRGGAEVSTVHANFIVNLGDATTADVLALMSLMRQSVYRTSGVLLEPEVRLLGVVLPWESLSARSEEPLGSHG